MRVFTNHPILLSEGMDPFDVSIGFKCEECGKISKRLVHECFLAKKPSEAMQTKTLRILDIFKSPKIVEQGV